MITIQQNNRMISLEESILTIGETGKSEGINLVFPLVFDFTLS
jgi:hypothetical protein